MPQWQHIGCRGSQLFLVLLLPWHDGQRDQYQLCVLRAMHYGLLLSCASLPMLALYADQVLIRSS